MARTYIQSDAYGGVLGDGRVLPRINKLIMIGTPNRGASKAWNPLHNNWIADPAYMVVLSKIVLRAYLAVLKGLTIAGPPEPIDLSSISGPNGPDPIRFINLYCPTIRSLLATYDFLDEGSGPMDVNGNPDERNTAVLDLNAGLDYVPVGDPNAFVDSTRQTTIIYGTSLETPVTVKKVTGPLERLDHPFPIATMRDFRPHSASLFEDWYLDDTIDAHGDGTVPLNSSMGQFAADGRVVLRPISGGTEEVGHVALCSNPTVLADVLQILGVTFEPGDISQGLATGAVHSLGLAGHIIAEGSTLLLLDPVDGFLVDGMGRRLGFTEATGPLTEIPNSIWYGREDGLGWAFGPVTEPLTLQLTGRGEDYYAMVSHASDSIEGGLVGSGYLAAAEQTSYPIPVTHHTVSAPAPAGFATRLQFRSAFPNPAAAGLHLEFDVPAPGGLTCLRIFDTAGRCVGEPLNAVREPGRWSVTWSGADLSGKRVPPGVYLARLEMDGRSIVRRFVVMQ